jgi:hypothetical protein
MRRNSTMGRALIRPVIAVATAGALLAAGAASAVASTAGGQTGLVSVPDPISQVIAASPVMTAVVGGTDQGVAEAEAQNGRSVDLSSDTLLVLRPLLAVLLYGDEYDYSLAGS